MGENQKEHETKEYLTFLKNRMLAAAHALEFDKAARYRDEIRSTEEKEGIGESVLHAPAKAGVGRLEPARACPTIPEGLGPRELE